MSRDYEVVVKTANGPRFKADSPTFNVNIWTVEYYGRIFNHLGLPTGIYSHTNTNVRAFKHEYVGEDLKTVVKAASSQEFRPLLVEAVKKANDEMQHNESAEFIADEMLREVFPLFLDPQAVAVASDYCEDYYAE